MGGKTHIDQLGNTVHIYETGIYQNVYKDWSNFGAIVVFSTPYQSPDEARAGIRWGHEFYEYLYTAKMTSSIYRFEKDV
jgi:hypothetical protein